MPLSIVNCKPLTLLISLGLWCLGSVILRSGCGAPGPSAGFKVEQLRPWAGHGGVLALLGGMRGAVANVSWLRMNSAWERREAEQTNIWLELTVAADERPLTFWLNGARIMACDEPEWRRDGAAPAAVQARVVEEQAERALGFLEKGIRWHGPEAALYIEMANIHWRKRGDLEMAARCYRLAAEQCDAPPYAARIYGELLRALGRPREALVWLRELLPTLHEADPLARREVVAARIRDLERELRTAE